MRLRTVSVLFVMGLFIVSSMVFQWERPRSVLAQSSSHAPLPVEWRTTYGGAGAQFAYAVAQAPDGGYMLFGNNYSADASALPSWKSRIIRTDASGNVLWNKTAQSSDPWHYGKAMHQTGDSGYVIVSRRSDNNGAYEGNVLFKIDENGNELWNRTYQVEGYKVFFTCISEANDGGFVLGGYAYPPSIDEDFCMAKVDQNGILEWTRFYGYAGTDEGAGGVVQTSDGGYLLVGGSGWIVKTDETGNMVWNETLRSEGRNEFQFVERTSDNAYVLAGDCGEWSGNWQAWLVKIDINGSVQWERQYGDDLTSGAERRAYFRHLQQIDDGFIVAGGYAGQSWLVRTDLNGYMLWNTTCEGDGYYVIPTNDGSYAIAGGTAVHEADMLLVKFMRGNPPVVTFACNPTNASVQQRIVFNASASYDLDEDIVSYVWDFDDGNVSTVSSPIISHKYESPQIYNVTLTVTDSEELNSFLSKEVWVRVPTHIDMASPDWVFIGFTVGVSGRLTDMDGNYLRNENVTLQRFMGGNMWAVLAWDITDEFGNYLTDWEPATVGIYVVKVNWSGNQTFFPAESTNKTIIIRSIPTRISLALSSSTSLIGFQVAISGDLISDIRAVSNAPVFLSYSVTGGQTWNDMTQAYTASDGHYSATWMPTATGNYIVKASWAGNYMYPKASMTVNLAVIPFEETNVFSVISNSTVTELSFESAHRELTFTVEGYAGTMGFADVYVAKTLIGNIEEVEVKLNGTEIEYTATSLDDSWLIHFTYQHSTHTVTVDLGEPAPPPGTTIGIDAFTTALLSATIAAGILITALLIRRKRLHKAKRQCLRALIVRSSLLGNPLFKLFATNSGKNARL